MPTVTFRTPIRTSCRPSTTGQWRRRTPPPRRKSRWRRTCAIPSCGSAAAWLQACVKRWRSVPVTIDEVDRERLHVADPIQALHDHPGGVHEVVRLVGDVELAHVLAIRGAAE